MLKSVKKLIFICTYYIFIVYLHRHFEICENLKFVNLSLV